MKLSGKGINFYFKNQGEKCNEKFILSRGTASTVDQSTLKKEKVLIEKF